MADNINVGFIGMGNMAKPIANAVLRGRLTEPSQIKVYDPFDEAQAYCRNNGFTVCDSNAEVTTQSDIIFLLVKPQLMSEALQQLAAESAGKCFVSFAAGISTAYIKAQLHPTATVMRVMPNTPMMIGCGASALAIPDASVPKRYVDFLHSVLSASGVFVEMPEAQLNAVIAINASSPAMYYQIAKIMADHAATYGMDAKGALLLAAKAMEGAAQMLMTAQQSPQQLTNAVTSKGGTTFAMLNALRDNGFEQALTTAMDACTNRAEELSQ